MGFEAFFFFFWLSPLTQTRLRSAARSAQTQVKSVWRPLTPVQGRATAPRPPPLIGGRLWHCSRPPGPPLCFHQLMHLLGFPGRRGRDLIFEVEFRQLLCHNYCVCSRVGPKKFSPPSPPCVSRIQVARVVWVSINRIRGKSQQIFERRRRWAALLAFTSSARRFPLL